MRNPDIAGRAKLMVCATAGLLAPKAFEGLRLREATEVHDPKRT